MNANESRWWAARTEHNFWVRFKMKEPCLGKRGTWACDSEKPKQPGHCLDFVCLVRACDMSLTQGPTLALHSCQNSFGCSHNTAVSRDILVSHLVF